jgi:O-antigen/teichoic acid export membrane protein
MNRRIFHGAVAGAAYTATAAIAGVVQLGLVVRALPADLAGLWLLFVTIGSYIAFFDLGISPTVGREISFSLGARDLGDSARTERIGALLATLWHAFRVLAAGIGLLSLGIGEAVIRLSASYRGNTAVLWAWAIFSLGAALNLLGGTALAGLFGLGQVAAEKMIRCVAVLAGLALIFAALVLHTGIVGLACAWAFQGALTGLLGWLRLQREFPNRLCEYRTNWVLARSLAGPALKLASIQFGAILILQSANPLIAILIGPAAIPSYEAVSKIAVTLMTLALLIVNSSSPFFSMSYAAGEMEELKQLLLRNLRLGVGLMAVLVAFVAVNGDRIVAVWLSPRMFAGFPVLWLLLGMVLLEVHHVIFATAVMAAGKIVFVRAAIASGVLNIVLALVMAGRYGLLGIAIAVAAGQLVTNNWYAPYIAVRMFRIPVSVLLRELWGPMGLLLAIGIGADLAIRQAVAGSGVLSLAASAAVSFAFGGVLWWLLALRPAERSGIVTYVSTAAKLEHA